MLRRRFFAEISGGNNPVPKIQKIVAVYESSGAGSDMILGSPVSIISKMLVDGIEAPVSTRYTFGGGGRHTVEYILNGSLVSLENMFNGCSALISVDFSNCILDHVTSMKYTFANCYSVESINFGQVKGTALTNMDSTFEYMNEIIKIDMSGWDITNVTNINNMCSGCYALSELRFKGSGNNMKNNCWNAFDEIGYGSGTLYIDKGTLPSWNWLSTAWQSGWPGWSIVEV